MKPLISLLVIGSLVGFLVWKSTSEVVDGRYRTYMDTIEATSAPSPLEESLRFWENKLQQNPNNSVFLQKKASLLSKYFRESHDLDALLESDEILLEQHKSHPNNVDVLHALVSNCITRHAFADAEMYANKAFQLGESTYTSRLMLIDLALENGNTNYARMQLQALGNSHHFDEQIRWVKLQDAEGNLDLAIETMEAALANAKASNNKPLMTWSHSNLGDMYGHNGEIKKSYESFLSALALQPNDAHSLKGIGWIALSNDRNPELATSIWQAVKKTSADPALDLLIAEAAEYKGDSGTKFRYSEVFMERVSNPHYGNMYGSYLIEMLDDPKEALKMAQDDLKQREHPMTYCHYSMALHRSGRSLEAIDILEQKVIDQTEEPDAYYIAGCIFFDAGESNRAKPFLEEALNASYELGPAVELDIEKRLNQI